jgi:hypothetical protein
MDIKILGWINLGLALAIAGYFFVGIVVAIYTGLLLHNEKMYFAQGAWAQMFGGFGALCGIALTWGLYRLTTALRKSNGRKV